ncbi:MAG: TIGR03619 family F420-dependent LLM class oxidoreductase [Candidatus Binatia bacterium]|nr:TIGR03619 family F420-dependent LLM class oxidoreductase [Candidatus Binatia bacterium]
MKFSVSLATDRIQFGDEFVSAGAISEIAGAAEAAGYHACFVTDHPYPVQRWLEGGGHHALDPFVALTVAGAATKTIKLHTHIVVLPYRNPFLTAKAGLTLDLMSGGRLILGAAAGYLKGEFQALGADFEGRNDLSDEAIIAIKRAWTEDDVKMEGRHFNARGNTMRPRPIQQPHPPIWVGGNSKRAIRRAVELAEGWVPFPNSAAMSPFTRSPILETDSELEERIAFARAHATKVGRTAPLDICFSIDSHASRDLDLDTIAARVEALERLGVNWLTVGFPAETRTEYLEKLRAFGRGVL